MRAVARYEGGCGRIQERWRNARSGGDCEGGRIFENGQTDLFGILSEIWARRMVLFPVRTENALRTSPPGTFILADPRDRKTAVYTLSRRPASPNQTCKQTKLLTAKKK